MNETLVELLAGVTGLTIVAGAIIDSYADHLNRNGDVKSYLDGVKYCLFFARNVDLRDYGLPQEEIQQKYPQLQKYLRPYVGGFNIRIVQKEDDELHC